MPSASSGIKTRRALISVACDFLGRGESAASIQQIAQAANVSVGTVYTYFNDKHELFEVAARESVLSSFPSVPESFDDVTDPALRYFVAALIACRRPEYDPQLTRIIVDAGPAVFAGFPEYLSKATDAISASVEGGLCFCDDPEAFVIGLSGAYQNVLAYRFSGQGDRDLAARVFVPFASSIGYRPLVIGALAARVNDLPLEVLRQASAS